MFCKHEWEKIYETVFKPFPDKLIDNIDEMSMSGLKELKSKHIVIFACKKCGKIYKSVE
jgi:hypothetical protein